MSPGMFSLRLYETGCVTVSHAVRVCALPMAQVRGGVWGRRVHHLHGDGPEEQELRLGAGVCVGARLLGVSTPGRRRDFPFLRELLYHGDTV